MAKTRSSKTNEPSNIHVLTWLKANSQPIQIADYQRPYCWNENQVTAFVESILQAVLSSNSQTNLKPDARSQFPVVESPDIGLIVIEKKHGKYLIADGQQRILTFALLVSEMKAMKSRRVDACENPKRPKRIYSLLESACSNVSSLQNALSARKTISRILSKYSSSLPQKVGDRSKLLGKITMDLIEIEYSKSISTDPYIIKLFQDMNTMSKQLNGGQILKAEHLGKVLPRKLKSSNFGKIPQKIWKSSEIQQLYETWRKTHNSIPELDVDQFTPFCLNTRQPISLELFVDSPAEQAWEKFGHGFVQAVQAILLKQDEWWKNISSQSSERLEPFERLRGTFNEKTDNNGLLPEFIWTSKSPISIPYGDGFFQTINRFGILYVDYYQRLLSLINKNDPDINNDLLIAKISNRGRDTASNDLWTPGRLVCEAACLLSAFFTRLDSWSATLFDNQHYSYLQQFTGSKNVSKLQNDLTNPAAWLAINDLDGTNKDTLLPTTHGGIPTALFAVALCWYDHFGEKITNDRHKVTRFARLISNDVKEAILQVLIYQLLATKLLKQSRSVLIALRLQDAINAAEFSTNVQSSLWKFHKTTPTTGNKSQILFFRALLDEYTQLQTKLSVLNNSDEENVQSNPSENDELILNVLNTYLSTLQ